MQRQLDYAEKRLKLEETRLPELDFLFATPFELLNENFVQIGSSEAGLSAQDSSEPNTFFEKLLTD